MAKVFAQTTPALLIAGTKDYPINILVQNVSANDVYLGVEPNPDGAGVKLAAGDNYSNEYLTTTLYVYSAVADSELRTIITEAKKCRD